MSIKIAIDAGHGRYTSGKRCLKSIDKNETREWVLNSRIAEKVCKLLKQYECETKRVDDVSGKTDVSLSERCRQSNLWNAHFYLSIHHNAGINGGSGGGTEIFALKGATAATRAKRDAIYEGVIAKTGLKGNRSAPRATANFYVLRETDAPAVLIECGYMDSTHDTPIILGEEFADQCAHGIVDGLVKALKLKKCYDGDALPYQVQVAVDELNVRSGAGVSYDVLQTVARGEVFTITEVKAGTWGKLKSGIGWINIGREYCERV